MRKYNYIKVVVLCMIFFIFNWIITSVFPYKNIQELSDKEIIYNIFTNFLGYEGYEIISVINILPFAFSINYLNKKNSIINIIRAKSRKEVVKGYFQTIILFSVLFCIIHELINLIGLNFMFSSKLIYNMHIYRYTFLNVLVMILFYIQSGFILLIFNFTVSKNLSSLLLLILNFILCFVFINILNLNISFFKPTIFPMLIDKSLTINSYIICLSIGIILCISLIFICEYLFSNKDLLNEK